jgi:mannose-6-phosphate isomerase-like protein (cupin superfamily)
MMVSYTLFDGLARLIEDAESYIDTIKIEDDKINVEIQLTDSGESATLLVSDNITLVEGSQNPDMRITMEAAIFNKILAGEADFGALIGRSKMSDIRPINGEFINPKKSYQLMEILYTFMTVFFTPGKVKIKQLRAELAGDAHGAHPIPLVYWDGVRYAWYSINKGEILNEAGEKDPYPQAVIFLKGKGQIYLDDVSLDIEHNKIIYIPMNVIHKIEAYEHTELLWIAWNTP